MKNLTIDRKDVVQQLLDKMWILKKDDPSLYYQVRDIQSDLRYFFSETFRFGLTITHDVVKLEKTPPNLYDWLGEQSETEFTSNRHFVFLFLVLAFLEGKNTDQQFLLQDIREYISATYPGDEPVIWKHGIGYRNRLGLIRALKYAEETNLLDVVDQDINDFASNDEHDVLMQKTPFLPYFLRTFPLDVRDWSNLGDIGLYLERSSREGLDRKHHVYRKLFMEPIVYLDELPEDEVLYIKNYTHIIEDLVEKNTHYAVERFQNAIFLVKREYESGQSLYPSEENMIHKFTLSFCHRVKAGIDLSSVLEQFSRNIALPLDAVDGIIAQMREEDGSKWSKGFEGDTTSSLRDQLIRFLTQWKFGYMHDEFTLILREGAFRVTGAFED